MASEILERLRRRRAVALATAALAGSALAVSGCGGDDEEATTDSGSTAGAVASFVPATSPIYFEVTTDLDGPQWTQIEQLAERFPGYPEVRAMLEESLRSEEVDFETEVRPLLGDRAAVAALDVPATDEIQGSLTAPGSGAAAAAGETPFVGVVDIAEGREADVTSLLTESGATVQGEHAGVQIYGEVGDDTVTAVADGALILSDSREHVVAAIDAHEAGGESTLAGSARFTDALGKLPADVFGQAYVDIGAFVRQAGAESPQLQQLDLGQYQDAALAASLAAEEDGVRLKGVVVGVPDAGIAAFAPGLDERVPADAVAYLGFNDLSSTLGAIIEQVQGSAGEEARRQMDAFASQLPALLGVSLDDLSALTSGEHALVVTPCAVPGAALALRVEDGERARATLDRLRTSIPQLIGTFASGTQLPQWRQVPLAGGVQGWELPLSPPAGVVYGVDDDLAIVGSSVGAVEAVQEPASPLASSEAYQEGTTGMPDEVTSLLWLNVEHGVEMLRALGALEGADAKALANLRPVRSLAAWTTPGETPTFEVFVRIDG